MIKKGLALQSSSLREDELELEVPPDFVAGRLGGAHALQRISGRALASRLEWISGPRGCCVLGLPGGVPPDVSLCLSAFGPSPSGCAGSVWAPGPSYLAPLPLPRCPS